MLRILVPLMYVKYIFFGFIEALDLKRILNKLRIDGMCWRCRFNFRYVANKIVLICKLFSPEPTVVNLFCICCGSRQLKLILWLFHRSEFRDLKESEIFAEINKSLAVGKQESRIVWLAWLLYTDKLNFDFKERFINSFFIGVALVTFAYHSWA